LDLSYDPDPGGVLPVECLSLKVRTENEEAFNLAYDRCAMHQAERFSVYQGEAGRCIADVKAATEQLQGKLSAVFKGDKNSDRVLVRQYQEGAYTNFIVYHEKRTQAMLVFKGSRIKPRVSPTVLRPAQQDFLSYNTETARSKSKPDSRRKRAPSGRASRSAASATRSCSRSPKRPRSSRSA